jgi:hypothetical protein
MHITACTSQHAQHSVHSTTRTALRAEHCMHSTVCTALHAQHDTHSTACTALLAQHCMHSATCTALRAEHCMHCTICKALYAQHYAPSTTRLALHAQLILGSAPLLPGVANSRRVECGSAGRRVPPGRHTRGASGAPQRVTSARTALMRRMLMRLCRFLSWAVRTDVALHNAPDAHLVCLSGSNLLPADPHSTLLAFANPARRGALHAQPLFSTACRSKEEALSCFPTSTTTTVITFTATISSVIKTFGLTCLSKMSVRPSIQLAIC